MNLEKVVFGFFVLLAATLNFGFFIGDIANPDLHNIYELFAALAVSLIATVLKFGQRLLGLGQIDLRGGHDCGPYGQRGLPVRWRTAGQPGFGSAAGDRDRHLPPRMKVVHQ